MKHFLKEWLGINKVSEDLQKATDSHIELIRMKQELALTSRYTMEHELQVARIKELERYLGIEFYTEWVKKNKSNVRTFRTGYKETKNK